ncbi:hypothetical protein [Longimicrobium terrae]|uniref:Uncharacterized protein n=1 Tax=Longimicrobium terrae TaxID=1639882 RepID=A0A841GML5_9BACT|nr:hypothetical protein [Longimicrobium terrae]MBB4635637.1 hypothetical protein [Longimicrobium terrae]MBB6070031.1 hypothetical protein [Longimicrobium terrae]NNC32938.1 hypothetical protein [Longimicrobium terrae]
MPADTLSTKQRELLRQLLRAAQGLPANTLDGRTVNALQVRNLATRDNGLVKATERARNANLQTPERDFDGSQNKLRQAQYELLRQVIQSRVPVSHDAVDRRTAKSLVTRGLITVEAGTLAATPRGREMCSQHEALARAGRQKKGADPRSQVILRAVDILRLSIPSDSELAVGRIFCHVDDLLAGFERLATRRRRR